MIDAHDRVQVTAAAIGLLTETLTDAELDTVFDHFKKLRAGRQQAELRARYHRQMDELEAGMRPMFAYNVVTGDIDSTPIYETIQVQRVAQ